MPEGEDFAGLRLVRVKVKKHKVTLETRQRVHGRVPSPIS